MTVATFVVMHSKRVYLTADDHKVEYFAYMDDKSIDIQFYAQWELAPGEQEFLQYALPKAFRYGMSDVAGVFTIDFSSHEDLVKHMHYLELNTDLHDILYQMDVAMIATNHLAIDRLMSIDIDD